MPDREGISMLNLKSMIETHEDWLTDRVVHYAQQKLLTEYSSTLREAWRISICKLSAPLLRLVEAVAGPEPRAVVIGAPRYETSRDLTPAVQREFPDTPRFVAVDNEADRQRFSALGMRAWLAMGVRFSWTRVI